MRLKFDGTADEYHPATGLLLVAGEADYPEQHVEALLATGRFKKVETTPPAPTRAVKSTAAAEEKE